MKKLTLLLFGFALITQIGKAQSNFLEGNWLLTNVEISLGGNDETSLTTENFVWRDVYKDNLSILFTKDGQLIFQKDGESCISTYKVDAGQMVISFTNKRGVISSTNYKFEQNGLEIHLSREDPLLKEHYTLKFN